MERLGDIYASQGSPRFNIENARKWYRLSIDTSGLSRWLFRRNDTRRSLIEFLISLNDPLYTYEATQLLRDILKDDFIDAGDKDYAELALIELRRLPKSGVEEILKRFENIPNWYDLGTEQFKLGMIYYHGVGVPQDYTLAHMWFNLAASNKYDDAIQFRDDLSAKLSPQILARAQSLAQEWTVKHPKP